MTAEEIFHAYHIQLEKGITQHHFLNLCPAIVYQIDQHACHHIFHKHEVDDVHDGALCLGGDCQDFDSQHGHIHESSENVTKHLLEPTGFLNVQPKGKKSTDKSINDNDNDNILFDHIHTN